MISVHLIVFVRGVCVSCLEYQTIQIMPWNTPWHGTTYFSEIHLPGWKCRVLIKTSLEINNCQKYIHALKFRVPKIHHGWECRIQEIQFLSWKYICSSLSGYRLVYYLCPNCMQDTGGEILMHKHQNEWLSTAFHFRNIWICFNILLNKCCFLTQVFCMFHR